MRKNTAYKIQNIERGIQFTPKFYILYSLFYILISFSSTAQKNKPYKEDLSKLRPKIDEVVIPIAKKDTAIAKKLIDIKPTKNVNAKVEEVLDSLDLFNLMRKYIDGYTIQIYSGQKREDAMNTKKKLVEEIPDLIANLQYQQPKFRVTVGKYYSKLEAQKDLLILRRKFAAAILVPEKIQIK